MDSLTRTSGFAQRTDRLCVHNGGIRKKKLGRSCGIMAVILSVMVRAIMISGIVLCQIEM